MYSQPYDMPMLLLTLPLPDLTGCKTAYQLMESWAEALST
jgi:hypothetical protein